MGTFVGADVNSLSSTAHSVPWPAGIANGDKAQLIICTSAATLTTPPSAALWGASAVVVHDGFSGAMYVHVYQRTCDGTETGNITWAPAGTTKASTSIEVWRGVNFPTLGWADYAADATGTVAVPAVSLAGTVNWSTFWTGRNSTPPTSITSQPAGTTLVDSSFTTGGGAQVSAYARANASESDGSVGSGSWTRNNTAAMNTTVLTSAWPDAVTRITKTQATTWNTSARVTSTKATTWNTSARLAKTQATSWKTLARVAKATSTTWATRQRVTKTQATTWNVAGSLTRITKTISTTWNTYARVAKATSTTWNVAASLTRITKTISTTWVTRARVTKTQATTWNVLKRIASTRATTWNTRSMISEATWPAFIGHRGSDPGPEETLFAYDALYAKSPNYWHEGDVQTLVDGTTQVASHDDTIDRMYSSGPVSSGNISSMTAAQWDATFLRVNTGFTGSAQQAMRLSAWVNKYGKATASPAIGLWENKVGTSIATTLASLAGCQGTVIVNCDTLSDAIAARAAGWDTCYQTDTPNFATDFTPNGIKYLSINYTAMTSTIANAAIAAGVKVLMYTVNSTANRDSMLALFSDTSYAGFISNKPQTLAGTTRISKTISTTWNTRARVTKTVSTTWNTLANLARITKTQATSWNTRARVATTRATTWVTRARLAKTTSTTWVVRARVAKTTSTTWVTRARVAKTTATTWNTRKRIAKTQATSWNVAAAVAPAGIYYISDGTTWVQQQVYVSDGSTWVVGIAKVSNGVAWN